MSATVGQLVAECESLRQQLAECQARVERLQAGQDLLVKQHKSLLGGAEKCKTERDRLREAAEAMDKHLVHAPLSEQGFKLWQRLGQAVQDSGAALGDKT